jgi:hypothetical protein
MALDSKYISLGWLENYFVNKDDGTPLAGGIVTFYKDEDRITKKPVYQLTGDPSSYSFVALPNPCVLSSVGTFVDASGNDVIPYSYPYNSLDNIELYYITVTSSSGVPQWTRQAVPYDLAETEQGEKTDHTAVNQVMYGDFSYFSNIVRDVDNRVYLHDNGTDYVIFAGTEYSINRTYWVKGMKDRGTTGDVFIIQNVFRPNTTIGIHSFITSPIAGYSNLSASYENYLKYNSVATDLETFKMIILLVDQACGFAGKEITIGFAASSEQSTAVIPFCMQLYNGNLVKTLSTTEIILTTTITEYSVTLHVPEISQSTYKTSGEGFFIIGFDLPINAATNISITGVQAAAGETVSKYPYKSKGMYSPLKTPSPSDHYINPPFVNDAFHKPINFIDLHGSVLRVDAQLPTGAAIHFGRDVPVGTVMMITTKVVGTTPPVSPPTGFKLTDGDNLPSYMFSTLYKHFVPTASYSPPFGTCANAIEHGIDEATGTKVTITNNEIGVVSDPIVYPAVNPAFSIQVLQPGTQSYALSYVITCSDASMIDPETSQILVKTTSNNKTYTIRFSLNGTFPSQYHMIDLYSNNLVIANIPLNATAQAVAKIIQQIFNPLAFRLPSLSDPGSCLKYIIKV